MSTVTRLPHPTDTKGRLAAKIRSLLGEYNLRQGQLAIVLDMTQSQVSKRLRGTIAFNIDELDKIADTQAYVLVADERVRAALAHASTGSRPLVLRAA